MKKIELSELTDDVNYTKYREISKLKHLQGRFIAYQSGMIVYIGYNKETLDKIAEKVNRMISDDPILIIKVGTNSQYYLKKNQ